MNIRRVVLDVDKARARPSVVEVAEAITALRGVEAVNITVTEIDIETVGMDVVIEGTDLDYEALVAAIDGCGAVVHSVDQLIAGERIIERVVRVR